MRLLSPWWLLLLPAIYLVIILHTLHPQRHSVLVPSVLLWQRVLKELAADARWRRIVANLLLLAQILALAALILALAHPVFLRPASRLRHYIVLLDTSASMAATDVSPNRLQVAKAKLLEAVQADRPQQVTVIEAGPRPRILYLGRGVAALLRATLRDVEATDGATDWERVAVLARSSLASSPGQILLVSDGSFDSTALQPVVDLLGDMPIRLITAGGQGQNIGITAFDARQAGADLAAYEVLVTVENFSPEPVQVPLTLRSKDGPVASRVIDLPAGARRDVVFDHTFAAQDVLEAEIDMRDALAVDNKAALTAYPPTPTRVLLVGPGNYYLEHGLRIFPQVRLERRLLYPGGGDYPLVIFDRMPVPADFTGTALYLAGTPDDRALGVRSAPEITWWDRTHPLTRFVNWSDIAINESFLLPRQPGARVLVESTAGPLMQLTTSPKARIITLSFSLSESSWPQRVAFPVFLNHLLAWAHPEGWEFIRTPLSPGQGMVLPRHLRNADGWQVRTPSGKVVSAPAQEGYEFTDTLQAGVYTVMSPHGEFAFAVNGGSSAESNITPRLVIPTPAEDGSAAQNRLPVAFWWPAAFIAFLLLLAEGWLYTHKVRRPASLWLPLWQAATSLFQRRLTARRG